MQYIHGTQPTSHYLALDPSFKNPADTAETHGLRVTIDSTATWNSQMERFAYSFGCNQRACRLTLYIARNSSRRRRQTSAKGTSSTTSQSHTRTPTFPTFVVHYLARGLQLLMHLNFQSTLEHQILFFESHFTEVRHPSQFDRDKI